MSVETSARKSTLPVYSEGEEIFNISSHAFGVLFGIGTIIAISLYYQNTTQLVSGILFGLSLIILYVMSCTYHGLSSQGAEREAKKDFQIVDHCSIPILITGTYIPFALCVLEPTRPGLGWMLLGAVCVVACIIITLNVIDLNRFKVFTMIGYFLMGGSLLLVSDIFIGSLTGEGFALFIAGGVAYSIGAIFYGIGGKSKKWMHSIFHVFCILGSALHCVCICLYVFQF